MLVFDWTSKALKTETFLTGQQHSLALIFFAHTRLMVQWKLLFLFHAKIKFWMSKTWSKKKTKQKLVTINLDYRFVHKSSQFFWIQNDSHSTFEEKCIRPNSVPLNFLCAKRNIVLFSTIQLKSITFHSFSNYRCMHI